MTNKKNPSLKSSLFTPSLSLTGPSEKVTVYTDLPYTDLPKSLQYQQGAIIETRAVARTLARSLRARSTMARAYVGAHACVDVLAGVAGVCAPWEKARFAGSHGSGLAWLWSPPGRTALPRAHHAHGRAHRTGVTHTQPRLTDLTPHTHMDMFFVVGPRVCDILR